ncbi:MAG: hypothetical protein M0D54_07425 [Hyphomonadaceae bacterium JAD_PAG50586_4]|nr:MAG: hypothetical protein M0D54_07425 [Hyphomonadaceae bacterium JAD_PAG50586_4]
MANVLFLAPADLGETVLATGALAHELRDGDKLTVVCAPDAAPLFRAAPGLVALHQSEGFALWLSLMRARFDVLIDARNGLRGRTLKAARRLILKPPERLRHRAEDWAELVGAERGLEPKLWLDDRARQRAAEIASDATPLIILAPGGASSAKRWPHERFAAAARRLATGAIANARVLSIGAAPATLRLPAPSAQALTPTASPPPISAPALICWRPQRLWSAPRSASATTMHSPTSPRPSARRR